MNMISAKPAYLCPLRDDALVLIETCKACTHLTDFTEYYAPREGGVIYCDYSFGKHYEETIDLRVNRQNEALEEIHRDEARRKKIEAVAL